MMDSKWSIPLCLIHIVFYSAGSIADPHETASSPIRLTRLHEPVILDGMSDEPAWNGVPAHGFVIQEPVYGSEPSERTEVCFGYDDNYLYVAGRLYDREPARIQSNSKQRDSGDPSNEWFGVVIDSFDDNENALAFFTTPAGLRWDATVFNDAQGERPINEDWDTFWDVAVEVNDEGWFAEFRIPFSSLRFQESGGLVTFGIISWRLIARKNEFVVFPDIPPKWGFWSKFKPSMAQECILENVQTHRPVYVTPYILGGPNLYYEYSADSTLYGAVRRFEREAGLDVKLGLSNNLTLDITLNTDFAQVEADDEQVNLTRFSLFFPEKRRFFQERSSNFDFNFAGPNRLFYSRRIGLHEGRPVRILGGLRLVGRSGPWDIGALSMQTAESDSLPSENFSVFRFRRRVLNPYSYVGSILTTRLGLDGSYNVAYGLDGIFRLSSEQYFSVKWAQTFQNGLENKVFSTKPSRLWFNWERRTQVGFGYSVVGSFTGSEFDPGIGFTHRDDFACLYSVLRYGWLPGETSAFFHHQFLLDILAVRGNTKGNLETAHLAPGYTFQTRSGIIGNLNLLFEYEEVPEAFELSDEAVVLPGSYAFTSMNGRISSPDRNPFNFALNTNAGGFYDGMRYSVGLESRWSASSSFEYRAAYEFNRVRFPDRGQSMTAHIGRMRLLFMPSIRWSFSGFLQYNSAADVFVGNLRMRYNPREGVDLYLVFNQSSNTDRFRSVPVLPSTDTRTILLKFQYTFPF